MDDDDNHVRRNLVVFSSTVILAAWLELPATSLLNVVIKDIGNVEQHKFWATGLAVLSYLLWRFSESEDGTDLAKKWRSTVHYRRLDVMAEMADRAARLLITEGKLQEPLLDEQGPVVKKLLTIKVEHMRFESIFTRNTIYRPQLHGNELRANLMLVDNPNHITPAVSSSDQTGIWKNQPLTFKCWMHTIFASKVAVKSYFPVLVGLIALGILLHRICKAYGAI